MPRFENHEPGHNKFWSIEIEDGTGVVIKYGAIDAKERVSHKDFDTAEKAQKFMSSQIKSKKKKKYVEVDSTVAAPSPAKKAKASDEEAGAFVRLENTTPGHNKFWQIKMSGCSTIVEYGVIGGSTRTSKKTHATPRDAEKFKLSMLGKKKKEGYVGCGSPKLFVTGEPVNALELEKRRDDWDGPDTDDLCDNSVTHPSLRDAPPKARAVAEALSKAAPGLEDIQMVGSSEGSDGGEVIVIADPGSDATTACLKALAVRAENFEATKAAATCEGFDAKKWTGVGFNRAILSGEEPEDYDAEDEIGDDPDLMEEFNKVKEVTKVMASKLTKHFIFNLNDSFAVAPVIYGGYAEDGNIVAVLTSRVWT